MRHSGPNGTGLRKGWLLAAVAVLASLALIAALVLGARDAARDRDEAEEWERHTLEVIVEGERLAAGFADVQRGVRGYLLLGDTELLQPYEAGRNALLRQLDALRRLTRDNLRQQARLERLSRLNDAQLAFYGRVVELARRGDAAQAVAEIREGSGRRYVRTSRALTGEIIAEERRLLAERTALAEAAERQAERLGGALAAVAALLTLAAVIAVVSAIRSHQQARVANLRAEADARFRTLATTVPAFIFVTDANGANTYTNPVFQQFTGRTPEQLIGDGWLDTLHPDDFDRAAQTWESAWRAKQPYEAEYRFHYHADGYRWFLVRGTPVRNAAGDIVQWVGACVDIQEAIDAREELAAVNAGLEERIAERTADLTRALDSLQGEMGERHAAEEQVRQLQKMEAIGQLTGGIAHDFNNMLAIVIGSLDLARRRLERDPARARSCIDNADEGAKRAAQLTARLLAFSRQQPLAPDPIDANKLVGGMSELLRRTIGESVRVETVLAGGLWRAYADAGQLENALVNLCVNARDAMPDGGRLTIETSNSHLDDAYAAAHTEVTPGQYVAICVTDTGTGMPPEVIERAFDPFYTTKGVGKGTGLGLSQVYGFVKQSGGHVKIYSEPGQGTTVKLYLPRHFGSAAELERAAAPLGELPRAVPGEVVLVVEDEAAVRHLSVDALRELGYVVVQAADANQALEVLALQPRVDLLFTDIVMPDMNGRRLADEILKLKPALPVLFTTGYTRNAVVHNGMLDPGVAFLPKPFTIEALAAKVRQVLDGEGANRRG